MATKPPVLTTLDRKQENAFFAFTDGLCKNIGEVTKQEVLRLRPYIAALSHQFKLDLAAYAAAQDVKDEDMRRLRALSTPRMLSKFFNLVAERTNSTILTEVAIAPNGMFERAKQLGITVFSSPIPYAGLGGTLGFLQFEGDGGKTVSVPMLGLHDGMMTRVSAFAPEKMLRALQEMMTDGNHDMLHQYTNKIVNPSVSKAGYSASDLKPNNAILEWQNRHFLGLEGRDSDPRSYESWSVIMHARVSGLVQEDTAERVRLKKVSTVFFDELDRICRQMAPHRAHETADYFGTMMCIAMMRNMPLNAPLFQYALARLQDADIMPEHTVAEANKKEGSIRNVLRYADGHVLTAIQNYHAVGFPILPDAKFTRTPSKLNYPQAKMLQLMQCMPWLAQLHSPPQNNTTLDWVHERAGEVHVDMLQSVARSNYIDPIDGIRKRELPGGAVEEMHFKGGKPHRENGLPPYILTKKNGARIEAWFSDNGSVSHVETHPQAAASPKAKKKPRSTPKDGRA